MSGEHAGAAHRSAAPGACSWAEVRSRPRLPASPAGHAAGSKGGRGGQIIDTGKAGAGSWPLNADPWTLEGHRRHDSADSWPAGGARRQEAPGRDPGAKASTARHGRGSVQVQGLSPKSCARSPLRPPPRAILSPADRSELPPIDGTAQPSRARVGVDPRRADARPWETVSSYRGSRRRSRRPRALANMGRGALAAERPGTALGRRRTSG